MLGNFKPVRLNYTERGLTKEVRLQLQELDMLKIDPSIAQKHRNRPESFFVYS